MFLGSQVLIGIVEIQIELRSQLNNSLCILWLQVDQTDPTIYESILNELYQNI